MEKTRTNAAIAVKPTRETTTTQTQPSKTPVTAGKRPEAKVGPAIMARELHRAYNRALQDCISPFGINLGQWLFLKTLWSEDGLTQRELSRRVGMMEPTTVTALNIMEQRNLINRIRNTGDKRKINVFLTDKAKALETQLLKIAGDLEETSVRGIQGDALETMLTTMRKILTNLNDVNKFR